MVTKSIFGKIHYYALTVAIPVMISACTSSGPDIGSLDDTDLSFTPNKAACVDGMAAGEFPCSNVDLLAHLTPQQLLGARLNDIWGWTDPQTGKEYALVGLVDGVTFVDISNPEEPEVIGKLLESTHNRAKSFDENFALSCGIGLLKPAGYTPGQSSWRDFKVFGDHLFVVSDAQVHGMQVFDLTRLREVQSPPVEFRHDELYDEFANAHNIAINEETGFAYVVGATNGARCTGGGLHMIDVSSPLSPAFAGCFLEHRVSTVTTPGYVHDTQCVNYDGPDADYTGKEICFNASESALVIADVTDKILPETISIRSYTGATYTHQGWLTDDRSYFLMNDEGDESSLAANARTYIWDVSNLDNPVLTGTHVFPTKNIDHNLYIKGNYVYEANYTNGLRILSLDDVANGELTEVAWFDTHPDDDFAMFDGAWSNYPFFDSGIVVVSDISGGLFILSPNLD